MKTKFFLFILLLSILIGCKSEQKDVIIVGAVLPLSGDISTYGQWTKDGIDLAVNEINSNGLKIKIEYYDSKSTVKDAVSGINKLTENQNIKAIIGELASGATMAMASVAEKNHIILFSPASSSPSLSEAGDFIFRNWPSDNFEGKIMADYLINSVIDSIGIFCINNDFSLGIKSVFEKNYLSKGGKVVFIELVNENTKDMRSIVQKNSKKSIKGLYIIGYANDVGTILKSIKESKINVPVYSTSSAENALLFDILKEQANGLIYTAPAYNPNSKDFTVKNFVTNFDSIYHYTPPVNSATGFDAIQIIYKAIESVGNDSEKIKQYLYSLKDFPGVSGNTSFDSNGDVIKPVFLKIIRNNNFEILK